MKFTSFIQLTLLTCFLFCTAPSLWSQKNPTSVEAAEKQIGKDRKKQSKAARKAKKRAEKAFWEKQSKAAKHSVKRNHKKNKKIVRIRKKNQKYQRKMDKRTPGS